MDFSGDKLQVEEIGMVEKIRRGRLGHVIYLNFHRPSKLYPLLACFTLSACPRRSLAHGTLKLLPLVQQRISSAWLWIARPLSILIFQHSTSHRCSCCQTSVTSVYSLPLSFQHSELFSSYPKSAFFSIFGCSVHDQNIQTLIQTFFYDIVQVSYHKFSFFKLSIFNQIQNLKLSKRATWRQFKPLKN